MVVKADLYVDMHLYLGLYPRKLLHFLMVDGRGKNEKIAMPLIYDLLCGFATLI